MNHVDEEGCVVDNEVGRQSEIGTAFELMPAKALREVAKTLKAGAEKYGENNWRLISVRSHLSHALNHLNELLDFNEDEDHLAHAATRLLFALELDRERGL